MLHEIASLDISLIWNALNSLNWKQSNINNKLIYQFYTTFAILPCSNLIINITQLRGNPSLFYVLLTFSTTIMKKANILRKNEMGTDDGAFVEYYEMLLNG